MPFPTMPNHHKYGSTDRLLAILLTNPYFHQTGDEVSRATLISYVERQYISKNFGKLKNRDILSLITKLINDKIFDVTFIHQRPILISTYRYSLLKQGKLYITNSEIDDTNVDNASIVGQSINKTILSNSAPLINNNEKANTKENEYYFDYFINKISSYTGECQDLVRNLPLFFNLICNILSDKETEFNIKVLCSLGLSYLVLENDYYPDHQENGYLDDLFVIVYIYKQIIEADSSSLLVKNWPYEGDIVKIIEDTYSILYDKMEDDVYEILKIVDLDKFSLYNPELAEKQVE